MGVFLFNKIAARNFPGRGRGSANESPADDRCGTNVLPACNRPHCPTSPEQIQQRICRHLYHHPVLPERCLAQVFRPFLIIWLEDLLLSFQATPGFGTSTKQKVSLWSENCPRCIYGPGLIIRFSRCLLFKTGMFESFLVMGGPKKNVWTFFVFF